MNWEIRPYDSGDWEGCQALDRSCPDGGAAAFVSEFLVPPKEVDRFTGDSSVTLVAVDCGKVVGTARVSFGPIRYEGSVRSSALLGGLKVHPDYRRQGIAAGLAHERIALAERTLGQDAIIYAHIQNGNEGSHATARRWRTGQGRAFVSATLPLRSRREGPGGAWTVDVAALTDLPAITGGLEDFYEDANFAVPPNPPEIATWLGDGPQPFRRYLVARNENGRVVAGLGLRYTCRFLAIEVVRMPGWMRLLNFVVREIPAGGVVRLLEIDLAFHAPGQAAAVAALIEVAKSRFAEDANMVMFTFDQAGPLGEVGRLVGIRSGVVLRTSVRADTSPDEARPVAPKVF